MGKIRALLAWEHGRLVFENLLRGEDGHVLEFLLPASERKTLEIHEILTRRTRKFFAIFILPRELPAENFSTLEDFFLYARPPGKRETIL